MELYMQNIEHGRMILKSVKHGPLWPIIEENGVTRTKKYEELSATEKIQADCDLKATNIILQGLPSDVYSLVNHHIVAKNSTTNARYFINKAGKGLIKDMNIYKMKLEQFQVNTKFLNSLPPEWSKFVTDLKLVRDLHTTNFDQLHAYLEQHELHANEVRIMRKRNQDPLALSPQYGSIHPTQHYSTTCPSTPHAITYPLTPHPNAYSSIMHQDACSQPQYIPQIQYTVSTVNQQTYLAEFPQIDSGLAVLVFKQEHDPIDAINKMMSFLSTVVSSRFPTTNNQLRNSSNPRQQVTIHDGSTRSGKVLNDEGLEFLADPGVAEGPVTHTVITHNAAYQADDLDAYDSDYDDFSIAKAVLMANLSSYGSDVLSEIPYSEITHYDMLNQSEKELLTKTFNVFKNESKKKEAKNIDKEIALEKKVKELDNIICKIGQSVQTVHMLTKPQVLYDNNLKQAPGFQNPFYLKKAQQIRPMLYDGSVIAKETNVISIADSEETLMLEEES
ncbi:hypothetical protein Tco_0849337 [Tanacetum coccineum]